MPQLNADRYVAEIEASTAGLAEILAEMIRARRSHLPGMDTASACHARWQGAPVGRRDHAYEV